MLQKPPRSKKLVDTNEGIPSSFITQLERAKYEKRMTKGKELEVLEDSETVKSFLHRSDPFRQLQYNVFHGEVGNMLSILPKRQIFRMDSGLRDPCTRICHTNIPK